MKTNKKKRVNPHRWVHKNKKTIVSAVSVLIVASMLFGVVAQLLSAYAGF